MAAGIRGEFRIGEAPSLQARPDCASRITAYATHRMPLCALCVRTCFPRVGKCAFVHSPARPPEPGAPTWIAGEVRADEAFSRVPPGPQVAAQSQGPLLGVGGAGYSVRVEAPVQKRKKWCPKIATVLEHVFGLTA